MYSIKSILIIIFITALMFTTNSLFAQTFKWEIGPEAGVGIRSLRIEPAYPSLNTKTGFSYTGGITAQYNIDNMWSVKLGMSYERKGTDIERTDLQTKGEVNMDYISIPLMVKTRFGKKIKFFVNAGPYLGILLSSKNRLDAYSTVPEIETNTDSTTKSTDFGISGGIGVEIPTGSCGAFTIELRDNFGFTNISESKEPNAPEMKTNTAFLLLGFVFKLGKSY